MGQHQGTPGRGCAWYAGQSLRHGCTEADCRHLAGPVEDFPAALVLADKGLRLRRVPRGLCSSIPVAMHPLHDKRQLPELAFDMDRLRYVNLPMFMACDDTRVKAGPLFNGAAKDSVHMWSHVKDLCTWLYQGAGNAIECIHYRAAGVAEPWC